MVASAEVSVISAQEPPFATPHNGRSERLLETT